MEIWKRLLMARDTLFNSENKTLNTEKEKFRKAMKTVRDLITEDKSSLTFSETEKINHQRSIRTNKNYRNTRKRSNEE